MRDTSRRIRRCKPGVQSLALKAWAGRALEGASRSTLWAGTPLARSEATVSQKGLPAEVIRSWVHENTAASFRLEGRELPDGYVRSPKVQEFIDAMIGGFDHGERTDAAAVGVMTGLEDDGLDGVPD